MSTLTGTIDEMLTPSVLGGLAAKTGVPDSTIRNGLTGATATILDGLVGKANDPATMNHVADLIARTPAKFEPAQLMDEDAPIRKSGSTLLGILTPDASSLASMVSRLGRFLGVGATTAHGILAAAASLAMGAFSKFSRDRGGLDASSLSSSLLGESRAIHAAVPAALTATGTMGIDARRAAEHVTPRGAYERVERRNRPWWLLALIPLALLAVWMFGRPRHTPMNKVVTPTPPAKTAPAPAVTPPSAKTPTTEAPEVTPPSAKTPTTEEPTTPAPALAFPSGSVEAAFLAHIKATGADDTTWFELDTVEFDTGTATIRPGADQQLQHVAQILKAYPSISVKVGGYTDAVGSSELNMKLSQDRAESVRQALMAKGVDGERIAAEGYGEERKIHETSGSAQANRRAAIRVTSR